MFCNQCGSNIADEADFCPNCGNRVGRPKQGRGRIDTIFSGLLYEKTTAAYLEFGIFAAVCVTVVLAFLAGVLAEDDYYIYGNFRTLWIFLMIFIIGYGALIAFRQRILAILYGAVIFFLCILIPYFNCEKSMCNMILNTRDKSTPLSMWIVFTFMILGAIGLIVCLAVHIFSSRFRLDEIILLAGISLSLLVLVLGILSYAAPRYNYKTSYKKSEWEEVIDEAMEGYKEAYTAPKNGLGTTAYVMISLIHGTYMILFFRGIIDNRKQKISMERFLSQPQREYYGEGGGMQVQPAVMPQPVQNVEPAIQFFTGSYAGKSLRLQGQVIIGSEQGKAHVVLQDSMVSSQHCVIRFNRNTGNYEVRDLSKNGVFLDNGVQLQPGAYMACARGTVLYLGSRNQKIRLR